MWDDGTAVLVSRAGRTGVNSAVAGAIWVSWGGPSSFLGAPVMLDQLDIARFSFLVVLVFLD